MPTWSPEQQEHAVSLLNRSMLLLDSHASLSDCLLADEIDSFLDTLMPLATIFHSKSKEEDGA